VAAWITDIFFNFYFVKKYKIESNSTIAEDNKKITTDQRSSDN
jgi:hypothetical protein